MLCRRLTIIFILFFQNKKASLIPFDLLSHSRDGFFGTCVFIVGF